MGFPSQEDWSRLSFPFHSLLQGLFLTQESNPGLPNCRQILYHLSHQGSPSFPYMILHFIMYYVAIRVSQVVLVLKNLPTNAGDVGSFLGLGGSPGRGNGNPFQYSGLGNPMNRRAWRAIVRGVAESRT